MNIIFKCYERAIFNPPIIYLYVGLDFEEKSKLIAIIFWDFFNLSKNSRKRKNFCQSRCWVSSARGPENKKDKLIDLK
jgi:hypothetical protein